MSKEIVSLFYKDDNEITMSYRNRYGMNAVVGIYDGVASTSYHNNAEFVNIDLSPISHDEESVYEFITGLEYEESTFKQAKSKWYKPLKTKLIPNLGVLVSSSFETVSQTSLEFNYQETEDTIINVILSDGSLKIRRFKTYPDMMTLGNDHIEYYFPDMKDFGNMLNGDNNKLLFKHIMREFDKKYKLGKDLQWILG